MFIGHLPAGFLVSRAVAARLPGQARGIMAAGVLASVLPDVDLAWFYLVDGRQTHHHDFLTHRPLVWLALGVPALVLAFAFGRKAAAVLLAVALANVLGHLALDSIAGKIAWGWPFSDAATTLVAVPAKGGWWVWNFVTHWTFAAELALVTAALWVWRRHGWQPLSSA
jgi:inner membrane protein